MSGGEEGRSICLGMEVSEWREAGQIAFEAVNTDLQALGEPVPCVLGHRNGRGILRYSIERQRMTGSGLVDEMREFAHVC